MNIQRIDAYIVYPCLYVFSNFMILIAVTEFEYHCLNVTCVNLAFLNVFPERIIEVLWSP